jgi:NAD dependent epimerase/dehydratase
MSLAGKRVLVTGGGGFIGSHLVAGLVREGCKVRALVRYNSQGSWGHLEDLEPAVRDSVEVVQGDVRDPFAVDRIVHDREVVFHLAALIAIPYSYRAPQSYVDTNVTGTLNVLEACRRHDVARMVHTSTSETYGTARYTPIDEKHPLQGQSPYSASKIAADMLAESYHRSFDLPVATLRPFNTFGPKQSARAVIPTVITQALVSEEVRLGSLEPIRDLTYVEDTVRGFMSIAECDAAVGRVVNTGNGRGISIGDLAHRILRLMGRDGTHRIVLEQARVRPENSEVLELLCDNRLAGQLMSWSPRTDLDDGLRQAIAYVSSNLDRYKAEQYNV